MKRVNSLTNGPINSVTCVSWSWLEKVAKICQGLTYILMFYDQGEITKSISSKDFVMFFTLFATLKQVPSVTI